MRATDFVDSVTGRWSGVLYGFIFIIGLLASFFNTSINPFLAVVAGILFISIPFALKSYKENIEK